MYRKHKKVSVIICVYTEERVDDISYLNRKEEVIK